MFRFIFIRLFGLESCASCIIVCVIVCAAIQPMAAIQKNILNSNYKNTRTHAVAEWYGDYGARLMIRPWLLSLCNNANSACHPSGVG